MQLRDGREAARGLFRIRAGVDGFLGRRRRPRLPRSSSSARLGGLRELHLRRVLRLGDDVRRIRIDEADDDVDEARLAGLHRLVGAREELERRGIHGQRDAHGIEAFLDALRDADFAFAREQLHRAHLAHVHAHGVGGATELGIERGERGGGFLDGFLVGRRGGLGLQQRLGVRCLFVHRNAHVVNRVDDVLDLLRIDDLGGQVIVHLRVGQVALLLAARDQQLQLRLPVFRHGGQAGEAHDGLLVSGILAALAIDRRYRVRLASAAFAACEHRCGCCMRGRMCMGGRAWAALCAPATGFLAAACGGLRRILLARRGCRLFGRRLLLLSQACVGCRAFLAGGCRGLWLTCHGEKGDGLHSIPLCEPRRRPTQGAPKKSAQFYGRSAPLPNPRC